MQPAQLRPGFHKSRFPHAVPSCCLARSRCVPGRSPGPSLAWHGLLVCFAPPRPATPRVPGEELRMLSVDFTEDVENAADRCGGCPELAARVAFPGGALSGRGGPLRDSPAGLRAHQGEMRGLVATWRASPLGAAPWGDWARVSPPGPRRSAADGALGQVRQRATQRASTDGGGGPASLPVAGGGPLGGALRASESRPRHSGGRRATRAITVQNKWPKQTKGGSSRTPRARRVVSGAHK